jgi:hypothetical protein
MNDELERIWKLEIVVYFKMLYQNLSGGTGENQENPQDSSTPGQYLSTWPSEYEVGMLTTAAVCDMKYGSGVSLLHNMSMIGNADCNEIKPVTGS